MDRLSEPMVNTPHGLMRGYGKLSVELLDPETGWSTLLKLTPALRRLIAECADIDEEVRRHVG
jgi:hypothetical protein